MKGLTREAQFIIEMIGELGYVVSVGSMVVEAVHEETGEKFMVRGRNIYEAVCELAWQVGIDLEDG